MANYLQIDGWWGSGKGLLFGYLDSHESIAPNPVHDALHMMFHKPEVLAAFPGRATQVIRYNLRLTGYYLFERYAYDKSILLPFGAEKVLYPEFNFDFYDFDASWVQKLFHLPDWTAEKILLLIHKEYATFLTGKSEWDYHYSLGWPILEWQDNLTMNLPNMKTIIVRRPVEQIIATRSARKPLNNKAFNTFAPGFDTLINSLEVFNILNYYNYWEYKSSQEPNKFMIVEFKDLLYSKELIMRRVADFMGIPFRPHLITWTHMGKELTYDGVPYDAQVIDHPEELLTPGQLKQIKEQIKHYHRRGLNRIAHATVRKIKRLVRGS